ncbi:hypothetical protein SASPL_106130 [Salvia splendens]|uniref:Uncharacterized protein n=1 Tax=Salvia splendens TaxID=180675 RepID=A0A8X8YRV4_SALSN|nr:hypothetical protein SASPL_106130 [Salvia splendens]
MQKWFDGQDSPDIPTSSHPQAHGKTTIQFKAKVRSHRVHTNSCLAFATAKASCLGGVVHAASGLVDGEGVASIKARTEIIIPDTPPSRYRSRSPPLRYRHNVNRSLFRRAIVAPISSESLRSDPGVSVNESETVVQETVFDGSEPPVPEAVLPFDDSNAVVPEMIRPCDESDMVVPEILRLCEYFDTVVPETALLLDDSESFWSTSSKIPHFDDLVIERPMPYDSEKFMQELLEMLLPGGHNSYKLPHMGNAALRRADQLPHNLEVPADLVRQCIAHLLEMGCTEGLVRIARSLGMEVGEIRYGTIVLVVWFAFTLRVRLFHPIRHISTTCKPHGFKPLADRTGLVVAGRERRGLTHPLFRRSSARSEVGVRDRRGLIADGRS